MRRYILLAMLILGATVCFSDPVGAEEQATVEVDAPKKTFESLFQQALEAHKVGDMDNALAGYSKCIDLQPNHINSYKNRATIYMAQKHYEQAIADCRKLMELAPDDDYAYSNLGWLLILVGKFDEARDPCTKAWELNPQNYGETVNLGHTFLLTGDREKARFWYEKTIPLVPDAETVRSGPLTDFDLFIEKGWQVDASREERSWLAEVFVKLQPYLEQKKAICSLQKSKNYQEAIPKAEMLLAWLEASNFKNMDLKSKTKNLLADCYYSWGRELQQAGKPLEAIELYQQGIRVDAVNRPKDAAHVLDNLGDCYRDLHLFRDASNAYQKSLVLKREHFGQEDPAVAATFNKLAVNYEALGEYDEAKTSYERALAIDEDAYGPDHQAVARDLNNLALVYKDMGQYGEAKIRSERALAIFEKVYSPEDTNVASAFSNLASVYKAMGQYGEAKTCLERALAIDEKAYGPEHPKVAGDLNNLAVNYLALGQSGEAKIRSERALAIFEKKYGPEHKKGCHRPQ